MVHIITDEDRGDVRAECVRVARRLKHSGKKVVGLLPIDETIAIPPVGLQIGAALAEIAGAPVAYVDANVRWPAIADAKVKLRAHAEDESAFATRWVRDGFAVLTPAQHGPAGAGVPQLARLIQRSSELFVNLIVDLTGFQRLGEHLAAIEMVDGIVVVGRVGETREEALVAVYRDVPESRRLGVLLTGGPPMKEDA